MDATPKPRRFFASCRISGTELLSSRTLPIMVAPGWMLTLFSARFRHSTPVLLVMIVLSSHALPGRSSLTRRSLILSDPSTRSTVGKTLAVPCLLVVIPKILTKEATPGKLIRSPIESISAAV